MYQNNSTATYLGCVGSAHLTWQIHSNYFPQCRNFLPTSFHKPSWEIGNGAKVPKQHELWGCWNIYSKQKLATTCLIVSNMTIYKIYRNTK